MVFAVCLVLSFHEALTSDATIAGPALVNLGRALHAGEGVLSNALWLASMVVGGLLTG